ncbi:hypothetical protein [Deminuibacter soli]|uniref:Uncharacterized protein n=1 Tax=Deminuibacter soli TaxID=2291815 RepID=A0A3E1NHU6_9BACT|nr:hypothetical protein [Deminuibacter soli]RFM27348.1 hypothetical protein DXN05_15085 [Deminuibacter soli]
MRKLSSYAAQSAGVRTLLDKLADNNTGIDEYKASFYELGVALSSVIWETQHLLPNLKVTLACSSEDADWLSKGILDDFKRHKTDINLAVFWNSRTNPFEDTNYTVAPITKFYIEPYEEVDLLIICKSIISTSCVIRTNLNYLIERIEPKKIFIASPVLLANSIGKLKNEFPQEISDKFDFFYFAEDQDLNDKGEVVPGIGGSVYQRLGLVDSLAKNKYIPEIVRERRERISER